MKVAMKLLWRDRGERVCEFRRQFFLFFFCVCVTAWVGLWLMVLVGGFRWLMLFSEWACGIPPIRLPTPGNWIVVFVTLCVSLMPHKPSSSSTTFPRLIPSFLRSQHMSPTYSALPNVSFFALRPLPAIFQMSSLWVAPVCTTNAKN